MRSLEVDGIMKMVKDVKDNLETKQEKEEGKGLSTNDYTTEEKEQVSKIGTIEEDVDILKNRVECEELSEEEIASVISETFN